MEKLEKIVKGSVYVLCAGMVTQDTVDQAFMQMKIAYSAYAPNLKRYLKRNLSKVYS
jgi:hypothetical protein